MDVRVVSVKVDTGGLSQAVAISGTSAQSAAITAGDVLAMPSTDCFVRQGSNPTAVSDGTDMLLLGGVQYRLSGILSGNKLAFKTGGATGTVYITPAG